MAASQAKSLVSAMAAFGGESWAAMLNAGLDNWRRNDMLLDVPSMPGR